MSELKLRELDAEWWTRADSSEPEGVMFDCPVCAHRGAPFGHTIMVPWKAPSPFTNGHLWTLHSAVDLDVLTLSPSVNLDLGGSCKFHGWVQNGMVRW